MKYLKISIAGGEGGKMIYPENYEAEVGKFAQEHLYYEDGANYCLLLCINDVDYKPTMIRTGVAEITEAAATLISTTNETKLETIKDEVKLRRIELLVRMGTTLTKADAEAIDPTKPTYLFGTKKILADKIVSLKAKEPKL